MNTDAIPASPSNAIVVDGVIRRHNGVKIEKLTLRFVGYAPTHAGKLRNPETNTYLDITQVVSGVQAITVRDCDTHRVVDSWVVDAVQIANQAVGSLTSEYARRIGVRIRDKVPAGTDDSFADPIQTIDVATPAIGCDGDCEKCAQTPAGGR